MLVFGYRGIIGRVYITVTGVAIVSGMNMSGAQTILYAG